MRIDGRRRSGNVEDRRGVSGRTLGIGGGIVGIIIVAMVTLLSGGNIGDVLSNVMGSQAVGQSQYSRQTDELDQELADFASVVLAGTEDVWSDIFRTKGWGEYQPAKMVLFTGAVSSACGNATSQTGPFYCSADQTVYIDLDFFRDMERNIGGGGDFAYAYVIAHEVGHHVQNQLGILTQAHREMRNVSETEANKISVRLELQADYFAGVWANNDNRMFNSIEPGDIDEAVTVAGLIGDDYLQRKAYGREMPDSFNHGRSEWRSRWLSRGIATGDPEAYNPFSVTYGNF